MRGRRGEWTGPAVAVSPEAFGFPAFRAKNNFPYRGDIENSICIVTALNPYIGYAYATEVAQEALKSGRSVYESVLEMKLMTKEELDEVLQPEVLTRPQPILKHQS
jgi:aspartate ammonia-lyase